MKNIIINLYEEVEETEPYGVHEPCKSLLDVGPRQRYRRMKPYLEANTEWVNKEGISPNEYQDS